MSISLRFGAKETKAFYPWKSAVSLSCYINIVHKIPEDKEDMGGKC